jgi:hypothetical protein
MNTKQPLINHVALVIDDSPSMSHLLDTTRRMVNEQIASFRNPPKGQENRVSIYKFGGEVRCVTFDSNPKFISDASSFLHANIGWTSVRDATMRAIEELDSINIKHGDHAFLVQVMTDGEDNRSKNQAFQVRRRLSLLPGIWTVAALVPNRKGLHHAKLCGFEPGNIEIWDATSKEGMEEVGETMTQTFSGYTAMRATGIRSTKSLFKFKKDITKTDVRKKLERVDDAEYDTLIVRPYYEGWAIKDFVESATKRPYRVGSAYYQLTKPEKIQAGKTVAVVEKSSGRMFSGVSARKMLNLPNYEVKVEPADFTKFDVFVQSTSTNRKLVGNTHLVVFK